LRVTLISNEYPPFDYGGIGSACSDLARNLVKEGMEVDVLCGGRNTSAPKQHGKIRVTTLRNYSLAPRLSFILTSLARPSTLFSLVNQADVVHAFSSVGILVGNIKKRIKKPVLSNVHGIPLRVLKTFISSPVSNWTPGDLASDFLEYPLSHTLMKRMLRESDHIVVPSLHALRDTLASYPLPINKFSVVPNGIDFDAPYFKSSSNSKSMKESCSIIYCGRLTWIKGVTFLVKAYSILTKEVRDACLKIIGWGPMGCYLKNLVSILGLDQKVHFLGTVPREKAIQEIRDSSFLVLPSLNENGPVVAYEAMGLAKPVIAFDFPFAREFVFDQYNGLLAKPCNVRDLSDKMLTLLTDKNIVVKLGKNAYTYARKKHNWSVIVKEYIRIYKKLFEL
jgi:glycogen(starch) synthase